MQKFKIRMNRRAVSPVIATLLLIAIAVAAAVVTYSWVMSMTANQSQQSQTSVKIDIVNYGSSTTATMTFRNTGSIAATIDTVYVFTGDNVISSTADIKPVLAPGTTANVLVTISGDTFDNNAPYRFRAITTTGFVLEGTYYTPASF